MSLFSEYLVTRELTVDSVFKISIEGYMDDSFENNIKRIFKPFILNYKEPCKYITDYWKNMSLHEFNDLTRYWIDQRVPHTDTFPHPWGRKIKAWKGKLIFRWYLYKKYGVKWKYTKYAWFTHKVSYNEYSYAAGIYDTYGGEFCICIPNVILNVESIDMAPATGFAIVFKKK